MLSFLFPSFAMSGFTVYLGRDTQQGTNPNEVSRKVSKIIQHPQYSQKNFDNDVALLQLSSPVTFTNYIKPVCLSAAGSNFKDGTTFWITGWGRVKTNSRKLFCHFYIFANIEWLYGLIQFSLLLLDTTNQKYCKRNGQQDDVIKRIKIKTSKKKKENPWWKSRPGYSR